MKKILSILLALISVISIAFAFGGCGENQTSGQKNETNSGDNQTGELTEEDSEKLYTLKEAYDKGWLNEENLKSIACCLYDLRKYEENPYSGMYNGPTEELNQEVKNEISRVYINQFIQGDKASIDNVIVKKYFGIFSDNVVLSLGYNFVCMDPITYEEFKIGGVIFKDFWQLEVLVYHL